MMRGVRPLARRLSTSCEGKAYAGAMTKVVCTLGPATETQERVQRIELAMPVISMGMTVGDDPYLMGTNVNLQVDVYSVATGEHLRTLSGFGEETALMVHGAY